jgi:rubrerythrin
LTMISAEDEIAVKNLVAAFDNEMTAHARYKAFAVRADEEGLPGIASLFRASACAEQVHAVNHSRVIRHMGGDAVSSAQPGPIRTTLENLALAEANEQTEINSLYPVFINQVSSHLDTRLVRTFTWALESEKSHARLHGSALALLQTGRIDSWISAVQSFYVCSVCGYTAEKREADYCPVCNFPWERFQTVS